MGYPPGIVMLPVGSNTRFTNFWICLFGLKVPPGTKIAMTQGASVAENQNIAARRLLEDPVPQWAWIIGDDHTFQPDIIYRLLSRNLDFVSPLCAMRHAPFGPSALRLLKDGETENDCGNDVVKALIRGGTRPLRWDEIPADRLMEVAATGLAGALVRRPVFEAISDPWFEVGRVPNESTRSGEDIYFCKKARQAGFQIWLDPTCQVGHMTSVVLDPVLTREGWGIGLDLGSMVRLTMSFDELSQQIKLASRATAPASDGDDDGAQFLDREELTQAFTEGVTRG